MGANWVASIESPKHRRRRRSLWLGSSWISREQSTSAAPCPREQVAKDPKTHLSIYTNLLTNSLSHRGTDATIRADPPISAKGS